MKKMLLVALASGVLLSGCSTETPVQTRHEADRAMVHALMDSVWFDQPSYNQESICTNWDADPEMIRLIFLAESVDLGIYEDTTLSPEDFDQVVEEFFDRKCN